MDYEYFEGGNPPMSAGMFRVRNSNRGRERSSEDRIAWWPAGFQVTQPNMGLIVQEHERTGNVLTREQCIELLKED
jgi:hypothetical protein